MTPHPTWDPQVVAGVLIAVYVFALGFFIWLDERG